MANFEKERSDNINVRNPIILETPIYVKNIQSDYLRQLAEKEQERRRGRYYNLDDIETAYNLQNFTNNNIWFNGHLYQTNINPYTKEGQEAIRSNFDYSKGNAKRFVETLATTAVSEYILGKLIDLTKWREVPGGAEQYKVLINDARNKVRKIGSVTPPSARKFSQVHYTKPLKLVNEHPNGTYEYSQAKVHIPETDVEYQQVFDKYLKQMKREGWKEVPTDGLMDGEVVLEKDGYYLMDIKPGNLGTDGETSWLIDGMLGGKDEYLAIYYKRGGKLIPKPINKFRI